MRLNEYGAAADKGTEIIFTLFSLVAGALLVPLDVGWETLIFLWRNITFNCFVWVLVRRPLP